MTWTTWPTTIPQKWQLTYQKWLTYSFYNDVNTYRPGELHLWIIEVDRRSLHIWVRLSKHHRHWNWSPTPVEVSRLSPQFVRGGPQPKGDIRTTPAPRSQFRESSLFMVYLNVLEIYNVQCKIHSYRYPDINPPNPKSLKRGGATKRVCQGPESKTEGEIS